MVDICKLTLKKPFQSAQLTLIEIELYRENVSRYITKTRNKMHWEKYNIKIIHGNSQVYMPKVL